MHRFWVLAICVTCLLLAMPGKAARASFIYSNCGGQADLLARVKAGYAGKGSTSRDWGSDNSSRGITADLSKWSTEAVVTKRPAFSDPAGDKSIEHARTTFTFGKLSNPKDFDDVQFRFSGLASARGAQNRARHDAAAKVTGTETFVFDTDATEVADGEVIGKLHFQPLRKLKTYETLLRGELFKDGELLRSANAGSKGFNVSLENGSHYELRVRYAMTVPHGIDPVFRAAASATLEEALEQPRPVPEPSCAMLLVGSAVGVLGLRPRRRPASGSASL